MKSGNLVAYSAVGAKVGTFHANTRYGYGIVTYTCNSDPHYCWVFFPELAINGNEGLKWCRASNLLVICEV